jgi:hypothetical protein
VRCHIIHLTVMAGIEPCLQTGFRLRQIGIGNPNIGETKLAAPRLDGNGECGQIDGDVILHGNLSDRSKEFVIPEDFNFT